MWCEGRLRFAAPAFSRWPIMAYPATIHPIRPLFCDNSLPDSGKFPRQLNTGPCGSILLGRFASEKRGTGDNLPEFF